MKPLDQAEQIIISREGFCDKVYLDIKGILTGGYGHRILASDNLKLGDYIDRELAETWLSKDISHAYKEALQQANELCKTSSDFVAYLTSTNYQLGDFETVFYQTFALLKQDNWQEAINHLQSSDWFKETPVRTNDLIGAIRRAYSPTLFNKISNLLGVLT